MAIAAKRSGLETGRIGKKGYFGNLGFYNYKGQMGLMRVVRNMRDLTVFGTLRASFHAETLHIAHIITW
jgi:hypothetical protein